MSTTHNLPPVNVNSKRLKKKTEWNMRIQVQYTYVSCNKSAFIWTILIEKNKTDWQECLSIFKHVNDCVCVCLIYSYNVGTEI